MEMSFSDATIFKFIRSERRWKEKGYGIVSFFRSGDDLLITLGEESFLVNDSIRPKGPNAFVMPVRRRNQSRDKPNIILAVRFERARDSKRLSELLSDRIADIHQLIISNKYLKQRKQPPPWFSSLGSHQKISLRNFIKNSSKKSLNDGSLTRELSKMYRLFPWQIEEAIEFFCYRRESRRERGTPQRISRSSFDSNEWSIPPLSPNIRVSHRSPNRHRYKMGCRSSLMNDSYSQLISNRSPIRVPQKTESQLYPVKIRSSPFRDRQSISEISAQLLRSLGAQTSLDRQAEMGPYPNTQLHQNQISNCEPKNTNSRLNDTTAPEYMGKNNPGATPGNEAGKFNQATTKGAIVKTRGVTPRGDISKFREVTHDANLGECDEENIKQIMLQTQNYSPEKGQEKFMLQGEQSFETASRESTLQITPLTEKNLIILNKKIPPLKGDFNTIVSTWLEKSVP